MPEHVEQARARLERLMGYLERDPTNVSLLGDAIESALKAHDPQRAIDLYERLAAIAPPADALSNLAGVAELQLGRYDAAVARFSTLQARLAHDPALNLNLAYALAMTGAKSEALSYLDQSTTTALASAAALEVELLHDAGEFDQAIAQARLALELHPQDEGLAAIVATLAVDLEDLDLARACASRSSEQPQSLVTLGLLAMGEDRNIEALQLFERARSKDPGSARAWLGTGMAKLTAGQTGDAAADLEHAAELFKDHVGSWIAAGWARIFLKDYAKARAFLEHALALDRNFAECHGSLAVLGALEGQFDEARRLSAAAMGLDRQSFSAAFARALLLSGANKPEAADAIMQRALNTPIDASGRTIAHSLARYGMRP